MMIYLREIMALFLLDLLESTIRHQDGLSFVNGCSGSPTPSFPQAEQATVRGALTLPAPSFLPSFPPSLAAHSFIFRRAAAVARRCHRCRRCCLLPQPEQPRSNHLPSVIMLPSHLCSRLSIPPLLTLTPLLLHPASLHHSEASAWW